MTRTPHLRLRRRLSVLVLSGALAATGLVAVGAVPALAEPVNGCWPTDTGAPVLDSVSFGTDAVDVTAGARRVGLEVVAHDPGGPGRATGVHGVDALVYPPASPDSERATHTVQVILHQDDDGVWRAAFRIPRGAPSGEWRLLDLSLGDGAGNVTSVEGRDLPDGGPTLTVTSDDDTVAPQLVSLHLSRTKVDTRQEVQPVTITVDATDVGAGVASARVSGHLVSDSAVTDKYLDAPLRLQDDRWVGVLQMPQWVGRARFQIDDVFLEDQPHNVTDVDGDQLPDADRYVTVVATKDTDKPGVRDYARTPGTVDVRTSAKKVSFAVRAIDHTSGVGSVRIYAEVPGQVPGNPDPGPSSYGFVLDLKLLRGDHHDGVWGGSYRFDPCTTPSTKLGILTYVFDRAGFQGGYSYDQGSDVVGYRDSLTLRAADHTRPTMTATHHVATGVLEVRFGEDVDGVTAQSLVVSTASDGAVVPGSWKCTKADGTGTACRTGRVRTATLVPRQPLDPQATYEVDANPGHTLMLTDLDGNPADSAVSASRS